MNLQAYAASRAGTDGALLARRLQSFPLSAAPRSEQCAIQKTICCELVRESPVKDAPGDLQARLGTSASDYQAQYPYMFQPGIYDVSPTVDPGPGIPNGGMNPSQQEIFVGMAVSTTLWCTHPYASPVAAVASVSGQAHDTRLPCVAAMRRMKAAFMTPTVERP